MKIVGYKTEWDEVEGLQPIDIQDIQIEATIEELNRLSKFLKECSESQGDGESALKSIELADSKPKPKTGISIMVKVNDKSAL